MNFIRRLDRGTTPGGLLAMTNLKNCSWWSSTLVERGRHFVVEVGSGRQKIKTLEVAQPRIRNLVGADEFEVTPDGKTAAVLMTRYAQQ